MTRITLHGDALYTDGAPPVLGSQAPKFTLATTSLADVGLDHYGRACKVLDIVPSVEVPSCVLSARRLAEIVPREALLLVIAPDLPFAIQRFCETHALERVVALSTFRSPGFARAFGVGIVSGPLRGLLARAVIVLDAQHRVRYAELVREITGEPDYGKVVHALDAARRPAATVGP